MLSKDKLEKLHQRMELLHIKKEDVVEKFILGSGKGGQKMNKTSSTVYLKHLPTGIEVKCRQERSRELNRYYAHKLLCDKIEKQILKIKTEHDKKLAKIRKQKKRRSRKLQAKIVQGKRQHSEKKILRKSPSISSEE